ncbi:MAG TPA: hypothetical protein ENI15_08260 [Spirochaetes bacterium]|nr:hypothetical protein [Spirochaetota bacterium]
MSIEQKKILDMLTAQKINTDEAEKLLSAISGNEHEHDEAHYVHSKSGKKKLKYLRIIVEPNSENKEKGERVNIRVPLKLIRSGLKWASFIPKETKKKVTEALQDRGIEIDLSSMTSDDLEELIENFNDLTVNVEGQETIRIFCE